MPGSYTIGCAEIAPIGATGVTKLRLAQHQRRKDLGEEALKKPRALERKKLKEAPGFGTETMKKPRPLERQR